MRKAVLSVAVFLALPAAGAFAQEDMERRAAELKKWYEGARREAEEQFRATMQKLERAFEEKMQGIRREGEQQKREGEKRIPEKRPPKDVPEREFRKDAPPPRGGEGIERMMDELFRAVKRLEGQLQDLREDMDRMRRGGGDREFDRKEPPRPPKPPAPPREREMEREKFEFKFDREMPERFRQFGEEFREMFRDKGFDWERFSDRFPKEFRDGGPDKMFRFFKEQHEWFPKGADRERWFQEFEGWMKKHRPDEKRFEEKKVEKKKSEKKPRDEDQDDERREY